MMQVGRCNENHGFRGLQARDTSTYSRGARSKSRNARGKFVIKDSTGTIGKVEVVQGKHSRIPSPCADPWVPRLRGLEGVRLVRNYLFHLKERFVDLALEIEKRF